MRELKESERPKHGACRLAILCYGEDGSWLSDVVVSVSRGSNTLTFDMRDRRERPEVLVEVVPGEYKVECSPTESIAYFYKPKAIVCNVTDSTTLKVVLPLAVSGGED